MKSFIAKLLRPFIEEAIRQIRKERADKEDSDETPIFRDNRNYRPSD
jgi:hypothetical protein